jgi:hypothetical protein
MPDPVPSPHDRFAPTLAQLAEALETLFTVASGIQDALQQGANPPTATELGHMVAVLAGQQAMLAATVAVLVRREQQRQPAPG